MRVRVRGDKRKRWGVLLIIFTFMIVGSIIIRDAFIMAKVSVPQNVMKEDVEKTTLITEELNRYVYQEGFYYEELSSELKTKITGYSFPSEFDSRYTTIDYDDLRYVRVKYYDFDKEEHQDGEMIVNKEIAMDIVSIFYELYLNKYAFSKIKLVEEYDASDELSMEDNNTSAFNYRIVESGDKLSWHCFGLAIDINPFYNPYILGNELYPKTASLYTNRTLEFDGKIDHDDLAYQIFTKYGFKWGGDFVYTKDYQHFYKDIYDDSVRESRE